MKIKGISLTVTNLNTFTFENLAAIVANFAKIDGENNFVCLKSRMLSAKHTFSEGRSKALLEHMQNPNKCSGYVNDAFISSFNPSKIRILKDWNISTVTEQKLYTCLYDKRMVLPNFETLPFGFCL